METASALSMLALSVTVKEMVPFRVTEEARKLARAWAAMGVVLLSSYVKFRRNPAAFRRVDIHIQGRQGAVIGENRDETELFFRTVIDDGVNVLFFAVFQLDIGIAVGVCGAVGFDVVYDLLVIYLDNGLGRRVGGLFDRDGAGIGDTAGNGRDFCGTGFSGSDIAAGGNGSDTGIAAFPDDALFGVFQCQLDVGSGLQSQRGGG